MAKGKGGDGPPPNDQRTIAKMKAAIMGVDSETPFSLGIEGEYWEESIPALVVPVGGERHVLVVRVATGGNMDNMSVITAAHWEMFESPLLAAAFIYNLMGSYHGGKKVEAAQPRKA